MNSQDLPTKDGPLTVNEQVIVMSGHETIRVLEVEVDAPPSQKEKAGTLQGATDTMDGPPPSSEDPQVEDPLWRTVILPDRQWNGWKEADAAVQSSAADGKSEGNAREELARPGRATCSCVSLPQPQTTLPITIQGCPQVLSQESLATLMTGMMAQTGSLGQPLLIPLSVPGPIAGQGGVALLTLPTTNLASLPGFAATNVAGNLLKLPFAGLQVQCRLLGSSAPVSQFPHLHSHHHQCHVQHGWSHQSDHHKCPRTGKSPHQPSCADRHPSAALQCPGPDRRHVGERTNSGRHLCRRPSKSRRAVSAFQTKRAGRPAARALMVQRGLISTSALYVRSLWFRPRRRLQWSSPRSHPSLKTSTTLSPTGPIACGDAAKVGQLVSKPQQGVGGEEGINLEEIREFAKNFKIRRLSLGLTQTQVGQALTATEGPAYSQSAICRFEKLDITPKSAQKLKPVLEKWLAEAEHWNQKGQQNLMEFVGGEPSKKRKRRTSFTPQAIEVLNTYFKKNALPTGQEITEIARELNYDREVVRVWFCNRRQTLKNTSKINVFQA
ncbi:unnamed protein product, partial [Tetraodon nigroviridis]